MYRKARCYSIFIFMVLPHFVGASPSCTQPVAKVVSVQGKVERQYSGSSDWKTVRTDDNFCPGDTIHTEKWSRATLILSNESLITLDQGSTLIFSEHKKNAYPWLLKLIEGSTFFRSRQPQRLNIQTPFINAVHEGTEFLVAVDGQQTKISVFDGRVSAENRAGRIQINKGFSGIAKKSRPPRLLALIVTPADAVQWALYYPPIVDFRQHTLPLAPSGLKFAIEQYQLGDIHQALTILNEFPVSQQNAEYFLLKASLLLTVGRVDEAQISIAQAQSTQSDRSMLLALQSIIAVAKNRQSIALDMALKAGTLNPKSAVAKIALSYAYQSGFKIEEALKATQQAIQLTPDNALAWARLAELQLSMGERDDALIAAQQAKKLNPNLARTQTILGFAGLAQVDIPAAKQAFKQAIILDPSDPLPRLGLGLAKIRKGKLEEGTKEIETAVNLDPDNAVMRSYLGKAYYELRNQEFAGTELNIAKEMDPKDPTPWFYDAILKQTTNRPVEALHDMQKAIELNDNRGVYRSSLLLDKDLAARSAAQGRIYNELNFQQLGLLEGWKSVNQDSSNYSAHRLLADNYSALPRHEVARVSELLQSQLLQPVNITPIQPNLAESHLFILNGLGPSDLSFNEFNPLFEYNRFTLQASGLYGGNNTIGDNVTLSGLHDNVSLNLGQFHYETDGFRENNFLEKDLFNAFLQGQLTEKLNLQAEYRHEERNNGDLSINLDPSNFSNEFKEKINIDGYRAGGRYEFNPNSLLIGSLIYQEVDTHQNRIDLSELLSFSGIPIPNPVETTTERKGFISELQHIYIHSKYTITNGFGHINQYTDEINTFSRDIDRSRVELSRTNIYNYTKFYLAEKLAATLGLSVDFYNKEDQQQTPLNPKFGIEWNLSSSTTFRAAVFRGMSLTRISNQTIEPTQIAGFNQFFDDINGTVSWRFGAGVDHKFSKTIATGLEYSERKLYIPGNLPSVDRSEQVGRAYFYFTPHESVSLATEYFYEKIDQPGRIISSDNAISGGLFDVVKTHRAPVTLSFFHPSGLSFRIKNSFIHQSGVFQNPKTARRSADDSDFFIVDMNLSYRFPQRYGMIGLGINNIFDDQIHYQSTNINESILAPGRLLYSRVTLAF